MSVKIEYKSGKEKVFCKKCPIEKQLLNSLRIRVSTKDDDGAEAQRLVESLQQASRYSVLEPIALKVEYGDTLCGARIAKALKELVNRINFTWITKKLIENQQKTEKKINSILSFIKDNRNA